MAVDGLDDTRDVMQVHTEGYGRIGSQSLLDDLVYLVEIVHRLSIDPDDRNHIEEAPSFGELLWRHKDITLQLRKQVPNHCIVRLKGLGIMFAQ
jgi:hypothetical protein